MHLHSMKGGLSIVIVQIALCAVNLLLMGAVALVFRLARKQFQQTQNAGILKEKSMGA